MRASQPEPPPPNTHRTRRCSTTWEARRAWCTPGVVGYDVATLALVAVFAARFIVQRWLYDEDATSWPALARIVMGYPLLALALLVALWAVRRPDKRLWMLAKGRVAVEK